MNRMWSAGFGSKPDAPGVSRAIAGEADLDWLRISAATGVAVTLAARRSLATREVGLRKTVPGSGPRDL
jgi:hypothetical protein